MQDFKEAYNQLNKTQKQAVDTVYGPLLVVAGPGSGKTQILSLRVANILQKTDTLPGNILCLTFTDAAAVNMRKRLASIIGKDAYRVAIHTFHGFGTEIISRHPEFFYNAASFSPADEIAQIECLSKIFKNLSYDNPLNKTYFNQGFSYLKPTLKAIGQVKKAGLSPEEFLEIINHNQKIFEILNPLFESIFSKTISKSIIPEAKKMMTAFETLNFSKDFPVPHFGPINEIIKKNLLLALDESGDESTKPLTAFKSRWLIRNEEKRICFKDSLNFEKMTALGRVYKEYSEIMRESGYFDFDDMLLDTIQTLQQNKVLRYELQEQYQFILVDEFQDTNDAQMRLLDLIAQSEISPNEPNLMAVGDDDQAVYKFQGAELSNILDFQERYKAPIISLLENYRSTQEILELAKQIIRQGENRLENKLEELKKDLVAINPKKQTGEISFKSFPTNVHEFHWVAKKISGLIKAGEEPNEIAIIAREHKILQEVSTYLQKQKVPVSYERQRDVLTQPHIKQIITIAEYVSSLSGKSESEDNLLPEILSYPFWEIDRIKIWQISLTANKERKPWLESMLEFPDKKINAIARFLIDLSGIAKYETLEHVLDSIIGSPVALTDEEEVVENVSYLTPHTTHRSSPLKEYYFSKENLKHNTQEYLLFLSALRVFYGALREYKQGEILKIQDLVEFVKIHQEHKLSLPDQTPFIDSQNAVNLMTAHKAKGQEFNTVFVLSCQNDIWAKTKNFSLLSFPGNLSIAPAGDTQDDQLRLFYVALTRSKRNLFLSSYETNEKGDPSLALNFIVNKFSLKEDTLDNDEIIEAISSPILALHAPPFKNNEKILLEQFLQEYKLSPTHLNNFLDLSRGGPQNFIEQNLLFFPQAKSPSGSFGSAIHKAVEQLHVYLKNQGELPKLDFLLQKFEQALKNERLGDQDFSQYLLRGRLILKNYFDRNQNNFSQTDQIEVNFRNRGVVLGEALLTGKIDKIKEMDPKEIIVFDLKTGQSLSNWQGKGEYEKIKAYKYKNQLGFYKLLIENSQDFLKYKINQGILEFIEASKNDNPILELNLEKDFIDRLSKLVQTVYSRIVSLDFPDVSKYSPDIKGILEFEESLVNSN
ncbi:MAG: hypothetical protein A2418_00510 [Candidatus Brennerbacteria bacterium RIFOXYC1_FULL_41_11]|uniref:DNA 3'-5' helicase n=1 Tax=Candidatus Brennerbacteria bacterium RIFOXYD1_FULL_41_16 TaxID=1797529 RepID=A0A1G1XK58_9BACT|nr:MAG: UvrD/REP helicase [Parcubacteria group bacterium GW2011_GWB1_41_4]OGY39314.1 MAG: hypothetical protein A2391_01970 [Candidatus Brennerbacteria bacterium RIFOXYB1_FULL_41_13]OGY39717.1 MAG: hypothetical protein A2418_00510 [Candidatus Brennerbacteria bacterium RIFOXYC1_FULL_41_11]OGY40341.1 MAG: hypothetical protein A2570_03635 [Candidatus Brennerbacteria bacterium RIFOXYD1_FULL_41_16]